MVTYSSGVTPDTHGFSGLTTLLETGEPVA